MEKTVSHNARNAFLYLMSFFTLGFVAFAVGNILFQIINYFYPDPELYVFVSTDALNFSLSSLIVTAPVFFFATRAINKHLRTKEIAEDSGIRKWLTYLILLITALTMIGDLIAVINDYLQGDLVLRFFLKALVVLLIAGLIFTYYFLDIQSVKSDLRQKRQTIFRAVFWLMIVAPFVSAFFVVDSPAINRDKKIDERIINELQNVSYSMSDFYSANSQLPENVQELEDFYKNRGYGNLTELQKHNFEYRKIDDDTYELCAEFLRSNKNEPQAEFYGRTFLHEAGRTCFEFSLDKTLIKPMAL